MVYTSAPTSPYGTYKVEPTDHGLKFQVCVRDPRNVFLLGGLIALSAAAAGMAARGWWTFLHIFGQLLVLDALLYLCLADTRLVWVEIRPDGIAVWQRIDQDTSAQFFDRRAITERVLDFDQGLSFRYGIHDIRATPPFANEREFEIFEMQLEQAIARLWHQENLDR